MVIYIIKCSFFPAFKGDRGFDGLAGLPGEKGHRVSILTFNLRGVCLLEFGQQLNMFIFVFTGWTRPPWTSGWSWRGWREGKTKKRKEFHSCPFIFLSTSSAVHTKSHYLNLFCSCTNDFFAGFFPNAPFCHHLNWTSTFSSYFLLLVDFVPYNTFSFFSLQKYLFPISLTFSIKHNWCNLIPHFLCFFIMFSHYTHTHTLAHPHFLLHYNSLSVPQPDLLFSFPGRWWRDRTQGTSWWTSEWSHILPFSLTLREMYKSCRPAVIMLLCYWTIILSAGIIYHMFIVI